MEFIIPHCMVPYPASLLVNGGPVLVTVLWIWINQFFKHHSSSEHYFWLVVTLSTDPDCLPFRLISYIDQDSNNTVAISLFPAKRLLCLAAWDELMLYTYNCK